MKKWLPGGIVAVLLASAVVHAQAGPPFLTDDPDTPGNKHFEINVGATGDHNAGAAAYQIPDFDFNYGWGDRIQLNFEIAAVAHTDANRRTGVGLGESIFGVKWRFYEHRRADAKPDDDKAVKFALGTYPHLVVDNPTSAVRRGLVTPGPQFLLPIQANARLGWLRVNGDAGYWFSNSNAPQYWQRGLIAGHEFSEKAELYAEIHDYQDANRIDGRPKQRETTLGLGGRYALNPDNSVLLLFMGGRSFQAVTPTNGQPNWIAYVGLQFLYGPKPDNRQVEKKLPGESKP